MIRIRRAGALAVVALAAAACGGGSSSSTSRAAPGPAPVAGPADPAAMRALLAKYSPSGHAIVTAFEALPERFELVEGPRSITHSGGFDDYFTDGAPHRVAMYMDTAVHEITHAYAGSMAFQLLAERRLPYGEGAVAIIADGEPHLVPYTATFPSEELAATFPADARGYLWSVYIVDQQPILATQKRGIYGLLEELSAFYQGSRTTVDMWPWVRDESPADIHVALQYVVSLDAALLSRAGMELFMLHWLLIAADQHPEMLDALAANVDFQRAFADVHAAYAALAATIAELEPEVHAWARERGLDVERRDDTLLIGGDPQRPDDAAAYRAALGYLDAEPYRSIAARWTGAVR